MLGNDYNQFNLLPLQAANAERLNVNKGSLTECRRVLSECPQKFEPFWMLDNLQKNKNNNYGYRLYIYNNCYGVVRNKK